MAKQQQAPQAMLTFDFFSGRQLIPGFVMAPEIGVPALDSKTTKYSGLNGETEIFCGVGGRPIVYPIWICSASFKTVSDISKALLFLDQQVGANGVLSESDPMKRDWSNCTFRGFQRDRRGILPMIGTLPGKFWTSGQLIFYQLKVDGL